MEDTYNPMQLTYLTIQTMEKEKTLYSKLIQARVSNIQKEKFRYIAEKKGVKQGEFFRQTVTDIIRDYEKRNGNISVGQTFIDC